MICWTSKQLAICSNQLFSGSISLSKKNETAQRSAEKKSPIALDIHQDLYRGSIFIPWGRGFS